MSKNVTDETRTDLVQFTQLFINYWIRLDNFRHMDITGKAAFVLWKNIIFSQDLEKSRSVGPDKRLIDMVSPNWYVLSKAPKPWDELFEILLDP